MQVVARRLERKEVDYELVWLSASLVSLGMAVAWFTLGLPWPICVFHQLTGLPCLTCGMTRCGIEFFHGHFFAALKWNPLVFALLWGVIAFDLYALAAVALRRPRLRMLFRQAEKKYARGLLVAALALNWFYLVSHWRDF
jgi:Protein of unknown function (DUF2752)